MKALLCLTSADPARIPTRSLNAKCSMIQAGISSTHFFRAKLDLHYHLIFIFSLNCLCIYDAHKSLCACIHIARLSQAPAPAWQIQSYFHLR